MGGHSGNAYNQLGGAGRCDTGNEASVTWKYADGSCGDTASNAYNRVWDQVPDAPFRVRLLCHNDGGDHTVDHFLQFRHGGSGQPWEAIGDGTPSEVVNIVSSSWFTDGDDTTQQLGSDVNFLSPNAGMDDVDGQVDEILWTAGHEFEFEFCVQIDGSQVADNDVIDFRMNTKWASPGPVIYGNGYDAYASLTVNKVAAQDLDPPVATAEATAAAGTVSAAGDASAIAPTATAEATAAAGTLAGTGDAAALVAPTATAEATAAAGTLAGTGDVLAIAPTATARAHAFAGSLKIDLLLDPPVATLEATTAAGSLTVSGDAPLVAPTAEAEADALAGVLGGVGDIAINAPTAEAQATAAAGALGASGDAGLSPIAAAMEAAALAGTLTADAAPDQYLAPTPATMKAGTKPAYISVPGGTLPTTIGGFAVATVQSDIEVANIALNMLGHITMGAETDKTKEGQLFRSMYYPARDALLRSFTWNFAIRRDSISKLSSTPEFRFAYEYPSPTDMLRLLEIFGDTNVEVQWRVEGAKILCDLSSPIKIRYITKVESPGLYDAFFIQSLAAKLAFQWAEPLSKTSTLQKMMAEVFKETLAEAVSCDSVEKTPETIQAATWITARYVEGSFPRYASGSGVPYS